MTPRSECITWLSASMLTLPLWHPRSHCCTTVHQSRREGSPPAPALDEARNLSSCPTHTVFPSGIGFSSSIWEGKPWFHLSVLCPTSRIKPCKKFSQLSVHSLSYQSDFVRGECTISNPDSRWEHRAEPWLAQEKITNLTEGFTAYCLGFRAYSLLS